MLLGVGAWFASAGDTTVQMREAERAAELAHDEQVLKTAGAPTDGPGLLEYFRRRTPSAEEQSNLQKRAAQLGSPVFTVRAKATDELIRAGRAALPWLRDVADNADLESSRRAAHCISIIEQGTRLGLSAHAARVLVDRNPPGSIEALLAYLPFVDEAWVEEEIRDSLKRIAFTDGKAAAPLEHALTDRSPHRRAAAAWIVGASPDAKQRQKVIKRLNDPSAEVRVLAASSLLSARESAAVPVLIALLNDNSGGVAARAEGLLLRIAGESSPQLWLDNSADNNGRKVQDAWESWWKSHEAKIDWKSLSLDEQPLGLTLVVENQRPGGGGRIYETNKAGDIRWQVAIQNPIDVQRLPGGRLLVADSRASQIYEMDTHGVIGWKRANVAPTSVQRLPNGNTVVSTYQNIFEFTRDGQTIFTYATPGHTYHARKVMNSHYVWIDASGDIGEIDDQGKLLHKHKVATGLAWGSIEKLRNGRYLVALGGVGKVQEIDMAGKVYWEKAVRNPNRAVRLGNGHTLVASHDDSCVYEFDAAGNERWKHTTIGRPFAAVRR
jgi:hypothetical protein